MLKQTILITLCLAMFLFVVIPIAGFAHNIVYAIVVNGQQVAIDGATPTGGNKQVTLLVQNAETNTIAYIDQIASDSNGAFAFSFLMPENAPDGTYNVKVGGEGISSPVSDIFEYESPMSPPTMGLEYNISVSERQVIVSGTTPVGGNKQVTLLVQSAETNTIVYIDQISSDSSGAFAFSFLMPENAPDGTYNVKVGGEGISTPVMHAFIYGQGVASFEFSGDVSGTITISSQSIIIAGHTSAGSGKQVEVSLKTKVLFTWVTLYTYTTTSGPNGHFELHQPISITDTEMLLIPSGDYLVSVSGQNVQTVDYAIRVDKASTAGVFNYAVGTIENYNYVAVAGITGKPNTNMTISIDSDVDNIISKQIATNSNGSFAAGIFMPSIADSGNYTATITVEGMSSPKTVMFSYTKPVSEPITLEYTVTIANEAISITGTTNAPTNTNAVVTAKHIATDQVVLNESTIFETNGAFTLIYPIPEGMPYGEYSVTVMLDSVSTPFIGSFDYIAPTISGVTDEITLQLLHENIYTITVSGKNIDDLSSKLFSIHYNPNKLEVADMCSFAGAVNKEIGLKIPGTDIVLTEHVSVNGTGVIRFVLDRNYNNMQWSGFVSSLKFNSLTNSGTTKVIVSVQ